MINIEPQFSLFSNILFYLSKLLSGNYRYGIIIVQLYIISYLEMHRYFYLSTAYIVISTSLRMKITLSQTFMCRL